MYMQQVRNKDIIIIINTYLNSQKNTRKLQTPYGSTYIIPKLHFPEQLVVP